MLLGYNTNGLAHHDLLEAIDLLAEIGYASVAITLDHGALNPFDSGLEAQLTAVQECLDKHAMRSTIETGARFLLDPHHKHEPTLVSPTAQARARRVDFLRRAIDIAQRLGSDSVSLWSGIVHDGAGEEVAWERLREGLAPVLAQAAAAGVPVGFEPEPGMFIDTMQQFEELLAGCVELAPRLTLDIGHLHCLGETPLPTYITRWGSHIVNVHIEDMRAGVHEHLAFGEGEIDFPPVVAALAAAGYAGPLHVELSRHSHMGPTAARAAHAFLAPLLSQIR